MNHLTHSILHSLFVKHHNENWVFSPASYLKAMGSLALCAKGKNLDELVTSAPDILDEDHARGLDTYNCLLYSEEYKPYLVQSVLDTLARRSSDFKPFGGTEVVDTVNQIVSDKTHGRIRDLLSPADIDAFTKLIILNCVYFKRGWARPFKEGRYPEPFHGVTQETQVRYLKDGTHRRYYEDDQVDIAELPYKDSSICCYLVVPKTGLFNVFNNLDKTLAKIGQVSTQYHCHVDVPPFKTETTFRSLSELTIMAGVSSIFDHTKDWSVIDWDRLDQNALMWVKTIIQKAYIDFTREGTEAAAATAIVMTMSGCCFGGDLPPTKVIRADKPFLYVLADRASPDRPLFIGVVNDVPSSTIS